MVKKSTDIISVIVSVVMGLWFSIYHKQLGQRVAELWDMRFSVKGYQIGFLICGIAFIVFGFLLAVGIIRTR
jgi:hypothetical protein